MDAAITARVRPALGVGLDNHADGTLSMCLEVCSLDN